MSKLMRVDLSTLTVTTQDLPAEYVEMGGRWLTSTIVAREVDPTCHPLGPNNKLVFAPGIVTGTAAPCSGRISVGGKSPLTMGIKEANAGTPFSQKLARLGIRALVVEGEVADRSKRYVLEIDKDGGRLVEASDLAGKHMGDTFAEFGKRYPGHAWCGVSAAGEAGLPLAGVCFSDAEKRPSRYAGRGGLGAVMGRKGLKGIVVDDSGGPGVAVKDRDRLKEGSRKLADALRQHDVTKPGGALNSFGTAVLINILNEAGGLPTRNFSSGVFEGAHKISGEAIAETVAKRGGKGMVGHRCHDGCIIQCSNVYPRPDGDEHVSCVEYESDWSLGANLGVDDLDDIAEMVRLCNDYGIDTIEAGVTLGVAMEAGLADFGDGKRAITLLQEIGRLTTLGRILGNGAAFTGRAFGVTRVPTVKGQGMPAYEPRAVKGIGATYMTSPMGADHTAGYTIASEILGVGGKTDPLATEGKVELSRNFQTTTAWIDASGFCLFTAFALIDIPSGFEGALEACNGVLGTRWTMDDVTRIGSGILKTETEFNRKAGLTAADDRPPEFMRLEKLPPHGHVYDLTDDELDEVLNF
ncbi:MAG TPA: aldehyde ferredoxin oxidoreductase [Clostridiales bacterium]|nr:aldehyde ferredoxin oxidoreductase [Clostridiales bacterium]